MNIIVEKREIVGTLKTLLGTYPLLELYPSRSGLRSSLVQNGALSFHGIDDEGFVGDIIVRGDFVVVPSAVSSFLDVKRVLSEEEQRTNTKTEQLSIAE